jgi:NhaP-type Na+/H+ or K+/H+ antiporter
MNIDIIGIVGSYSYLIYILLALVICLIIHFIANKLKIAEALLFLLVGISFSFINSSFNIIADIPSNLIDCFVLIALIMVVFDMGSKLKLYGHDTLSLRAVRFGVISHITMLVVVSFFAQIVLDFGLFQSLIIGIMVSCVDSKYITLFFYEIKTRILEVLKVDASVSQVLVVFFSFMIFLIFDNFSYLREMDLVKTESIAVLVGVGVATGFLMFLVGSRIVKHYHKKSLAPITIIVTVSVAYIMAELLQSNGILAVAVMGLFYGNFLVKQKIKLFQFSDMFGLAIRILVFVLLGLMIKFPVNTALFYKSGFLFIVYLIVRLFSVEIMLGLHGLSLKERVFAALSIEKGLVVGVLMLFFMPFISYETMVILVLMMLYCSFFSSIGLLFGKKLLHKKTEK